MWTDIYLLQLSRSSADSQLSAPAIMQILVHNHANVGAVTRIPSGFSNITPFSPKSPLPLFVGDHLTGPQIDPATKGAGIRHKSVLSVEAVVVRSTE